MPKLFHVAKKERTLVQFLRNKKLDSIRFVLLHERIVRDEKSGVVELYVRMYPGRNNRGAVKRLLQYDGPCGFPVRPCLECEQREKDRAELIEMQRMMEKCHRGVSVLEPAYKLMRKRKGKKA